SLGLTVYKFTWTPFFSMLLATNRRNTRAALVAIAVPVVLTLVFFARLGTTAADAATGYWNQLTALTRVIDRDPGVGVSSIYPLLSAIAGPHFARVLLYLLIAIAFVLLVRTAPSTVTTEFFAVVSLLCLWAIYHDVYDGVLLFIPIVALWRVQSIAESTATRWVARALLLVAIVFWFASPAKLAPRNPDLRIALDYAFRLSIAADFVFLVFTNF